MGVNRNVISIQDGGIGSCGKGKVVGEIATDKTIILGAAITNCMPNAGHTYISNRGKKLVFTNIPVSAINSQTELFIGPGSAIDMTTFIDEYKRNEHLLGERKIYVHELTPLIDERHKQYEREHIKTGSTYKGCGAVSADKLLRDDKLEYFKGYKNAVVVSESEYLDRLYAHLDNPSEYVMLEGSQGCGLCLNHSGNGPDMRNTTSRNVSTTQLLADSGIAAERLLQTIMVIRPFPIRISNVTNTGDVIYTGSFGTGAPLTWSQVNLSAMRGTYPFPGDVNYLDHKLTLKKVRKLLAQSSDIVAKQLFGGDLRSVDPEKVTLLEALELERLFYKNNGIREYISDILIDLGISDKGISYIRDLSEQTTVTKMERRIGDLDIKQLKNYCRINNPYGIYLNFFQHLDLEYEHERKKFDDYYFNRYIRNYFDWLEDETKTDILALGTGAKNGERILKRDLIRR